MSETNTNEVTNRVKIQELTTETTLSDNHFVVTEDGSSLTSETKKTPIRTLINWFKNTFPVKCEVQENMEKFLIDNEWKGLGEMGAHVYDDINKALVIAYDSNYDVKFFSAGSLMGQTVGQAMTSVNTRVSPIEDDVETLQTDVSALSTAVQNAATTAYVDNAIADSLGDISAILATVVGGGS